MYNGSYTAGDMSSYGSYYNGRVANAIISGTTVSAQDYSTNICPKNWTLPTYSILLKIKDSYFSSWPLVFAGYYAGSAVQGLNNVGSWWSRTAASSTNFYDMYYNHATTSTNMNNREIRFGRPMRCLQK